MTWKCRFGFHTWKETYRNYTGLWYDVNYICIDPDCTAKTGRWEHLDRGEYSLDPNVQTEQKQKHREEQEKYRNK